MKRQTNINITDFLQVEIYVKLKLNEEEYIT